MIEATIDWMQLSVYHREQLCVDNNHKQIHGFGFYSHGYEDGIGVRRYYGNPNSNKCFVVLTGTALYNMRALGWDVRNVVEEYLIEGAEVSRLDLCITEFIETEIITVSDVADSFARNEFLGTLTKYGGSRIIGVNPNAPEHWNIERTETFYIGDFSRRGKNGIFRAYDKGLELGGFAQSVITRLELEERKTNAHNNAKRYAEGESIQALLNSRITSKDEQWQRVIGSETVDMTRGQALQKTDSQEAMERRKAWLLKQVAPTLASVIDQDSNFGHKFFLEVQKNMTRK